LSGGHKAGNVAPRAISRLDLLEFLDIAAAIGFDPGEVIRSLAAG
jgi:hypothetical protein